MYVDNVAPVVDRGRRPGVGRGRVEGFDLGSFSDPGVERQPVDGRRRTGATARSHTTFSDGDAGCARLDDHTYDDNGTYTVTVKVTDKDGGFDTETFQVTVANVAPTATFNAPAR